MPKSLWIGDEDLSEPSYLFVDADDNILVADAGQNKIAIFSSESGDLIKGIENINIPGRLFGLTMDRDGSIIVSGQTNKIAIY